MKSTTLDLAGLTAMTDRLQTFSVTRHDEGATTTILEIDNADRAFPMPEDGETYEVVLDGPAPAYVTFLAIGDTLRVAQTAVEASPLTESLLRRCGDCGRF